MCKFDVLQFHQLNGYNEEFEYVVSGLIDDDKGFDEAIDRLYEIVMEHIFMIVWTYCIFIKENFISLF